MTWDAAALHFEQGGMGGVSENTAKRYRVSLRQVRPHLQKFHADEIGPRQISEFVRARRAEGATNATVNRDLTAISRVLANSLGQGANEHNAARDYDRSLNREKRLPVVLPSEEDIFDALKAAPNEWRPIIAFAGQTGMRQAEILSLEWRAVDLERGAITLHKTKGRRLRVIPLSGPLLEKARETLELLPRGRGTVFRPFKNFPSRFAAWRAAQAVPFRFHDLRHWFAVTYLQRGGNIYDLQRIMGHTSIKTTELYLEYLTPAERRHAMVSAHTPAHS